MNEKLKALLLGSGILVSVSSFACTEEKTSEEQDKNTPARKEFREVREKAREERSVFRQLREYFRGSNEHSHVSNCNASCTAGDERRSTDDDEDNAPFDVSKMANSACTTEGSSQAHNSGCVSK